MAETSFRHEIPDHFPVLKDLLEDNHIFVASFVPLGKFGQAVFAILVTRHDTPVTLDHEEIVGHDLELTCGAAWSASSLRATRKDVFQTNAVSLFAHEIVITPVRHTTWLTLKPWAVVTLVVTTNSLVTAESIAAKRERATSITDRLSTGIPEEISVGVLGSEGIDAGPHIAFEFRAKNMGAQEKEREEDFHGDDGDTQPIMTLIV